MGLKNQMSTIEIEAQNNNQGLISLFDPFKTHLIVNNPPSHST